jgi:hypothetical protein
MFNGAANSDSCHDKLFVTNKKNNWSFAFYEDKQKIREKVNK